MFRKFLDRFWARSNTLTPLGRWGYHWEAKLKYQPQYYD